MDQYAVEQSSLTKVANAIRGMGGTEEPLEFPDGFVNAIYNLEGGGGGLQMSKLWENASPTSEFSPQTIAVDFSGFSHFFVIFKMSISATQHDSVFGKVGYNFLMHSEYVETGAAKRQGLFSDAGIDFSKATIWQPNNGNVDNNKYAIPREIYGIKGVIE